MNKLVPIVAPNNLMIAHVFKKNLESEGIRCFMENENITAAHPLLANAVGGIIINVQEKDVEKARKIIDEMNN